ncbi:MAG: endo-beta-N-acetylglucosaminidase, partial [Bacteroidales bacterium]|nr:endo-beta-N-acetylglucosaminidase [Bacteroidales bacterium]
QTLAAESGPLLDYYIIQAYYCSGDSNLDSRFSGLFNKFRSVEDEATILKKLFWTEDFERIQDGRQDFTYRDGTQTPYSIEGMSRYYRDIDGQQVKIGGFGAYRFDIIGSIDEYALMRRMIQGVNPANN